MRFLVHGILGLGLVLASSGVASAKKCQDDAAVATARALADVQCSCATATNHGRYVSCVASVAKELVASGDLPGECKGEVTSCAAHSTCGKPGLGHLLSLDRRGKVKCSTKSSAEKCKAPKGGQACTGPPPAAVTRAARARRGVVRLRGHDDHDDGARRRPHGAADDHHGTTRAPPRPRRRHRRPPPRRRHRPPRRPRPRRRRPARRRPRWDRRVPHRRGRNELVRPAGVPQRAPPEVCFRGLRAPSPRLGQEPNRGESTGRGQGKGDDRSAAIPATEGRGVPTGRRRREVPQEARVAGRHGAASSWSARRARMDRSRRRYGARTTAGESRTRPLILRSPISSRSAPTLLLEAASVNGAAFGAR